MVVKQKQDVSIELTKDIKAAMKRYGISVFENTHTVKHLTYGTETICSPSVYAVYELAICANYVGAVMMDGIQALLPLQAHYYQMVDRLPYISGKMFKDTQKYGLQANKDYYLASKAIRNAGLYMELLD